MVQVWKWDFKGEVERVTAQNRVAAFETTTPGYTMVNAELTLRPWGSKGPLSFVLSGNNLFDVDARRHASFLKDFAPLAGRDIRVTARFGFALIAKAMCDRPTGAMPSRKTCACRSSVARE